MEFRVIVIGFRVIGFRLMGSGFRAGPEVVGLRVQAETLEAQVLFSEFGIRCGPVVRVSLASELSEFRAAQKSGKTTGILAALRASKLASA